jgi:hypothetical protein|tara:strand:- start:13714 stop:13884 length:171 start_codon:yes stop_codon:yes gene_type:complete
MTGTRKIAAGMMGFGQIVCQLCYMAVNSNDRGIAAIVDVGIRYSVNKTVGEQWNLD